MNDSETYSRTIADELIALDTVLGASDPDEIAEALAVLEMDTDLDAGDAFTVYLNETALDVSVKLDTRGADYGSRVEILRTCGGPHCEITRDTNDGTALTVTTHYGTDTYHHRINLDNLADWLDELAGAY